MTWNIRANQADRELLESLDIKLGSYCEGRFMDCVVPEGWGMGKGDTPLDSYWGRFTWSPSQDIDRTFSNIPNPPKQSVTSGDFAGSLSKPEPIE